MDKNEIFDSVEDCIAEFKRGGIVIVSDDENRENEGDMIWARKSPWRRSTRCCALRAG